MVDEKPCCLPKEEYDEIVDDEGSTVIPCQQSYGLKYHGESACFLANRNFECPG